MLCIMSYDSRYVWSLTILAPKQVAWTRIQICNKVPNTVFSYGFHRKPLLKKT